MFTDMVGSTASAQVDEVEALKLREEQEEIVRPLFAAHQGHEIKSMGDGFLAEFDSALRAVQCAIDIQQHLHERNSQPGVAPIRLRIGVHLGDVEQRGSDIFGDAVNIASRIEPLASPGGVCLSGQVFDQVRNKLPNRFEKLEPKVLKNVRIPMDIYRVTLPWDLAMPVPGSASRPHLAVLPLTNISPDPKDEYFADGLTEELISALSKIRDLRVIARTSVSQYKSTTKTVSQIGAELGVTSVLEGSVRKAGNRLRITLQLIDASTQDHVWANSYDRELDDVFAIQTEIAEKTAGALQLELLGPERASIRIEPTNNLAAYKLYLEGIHAARESFEGLNGAIGFLEEAIRIDPAFPQPYALLANVLIGLAGDRLPASETFPRARVLAARALELDPDSSDAHTARGNLALQDEHDWAVAEAEFKRALSLNPSNTQAHLWYAFLLRTRGELDEAIVEFEATLEMDPLWATPRVGLWQVQSLSGDAASAIAAAEKGVARAPEGSLFHIVLGLLYADAGRATDARKQAELCAGPLNMWGEWQRAMLWAWTGRREEARHAVEELEEKSRAEYVSPDWIAEIYGALGEKEKVFEWLERNHGEGAKTLWFRYQESPFDCVRDDPRFRAMLAKLNLPMDVTWSRGRGTPP
jgi:TolB-like protein/tetratricopeptide (TPR) repeat protein